MRSLVHVVMPVVGLARRAYRIAFRPRTVGVKIVLRHAGEMLLVRHTYEPRVYGLPGGGIKPGEDRLAGLRREVMEELGIQLGDVRLLGTVQSDAEYNRDTVHVFAADLPDRAALIPDPIEIAELHWARADRLPRVGPVTEKVLRLALGKGS